MSGQGLRVLLVSAEVEGLARTGGLGDVAAALTESLAELGADVVLMTPRYGVTRLAGKSLTPVGVVDVALGRAHTRRVSLQSLRDERWQGGGRLRTILVDDPELFDRNGLYGDEHGSFGDNDFRFATFGRAALGAAHSLWPASPARAAGPDVLSAHDWHTALAVVEARNGEPLGVGAVPSLFTIHNLAYQGDFPADRIDVLGVDPSLFRPDALEHFGAMNWMKGAIRMAHRVSTVSVSYAREVCTPAHGCGLDGELRACGERFVGIVNGIDTRRFDPRTDRALTASFDASTATAARALNKSALQADLALDVKGPLFAVVSRLTRQKGIDVLAASIPELCARGARFAIVGQGDRDEAARLRGLAERMPGQVAFVDAFDDALARRVYSAADFIVVPSRFEPCGLTQLYAMRYGAIPVVSRVGGLRDTVVPIDTDAGVGTGILCAPDDVGELRAALMSAVDLAAMPDALVAARTRAMNVDSSWERSAERYLSLFHAMCESSTSSR